MKVLFLSPYLPSRIRVRPYHWVRSLVALGHEVHLVALAPPEDAAASPEELRRLCTGVEVFPLSRARTVANALRAAPHPSTPIQLAYSHQPEAERRVARLASGGHFDVVHVEHLRGVSLATRVRGVPVVWDAVDSIAALFADAMRHAPSRAARWTARFDLARTRRFEAWAPFRFARVVLTSEREAGAFASRSGGGSRERVVVIPNGVDLEHFGAIPSATRDAVVFTGKLSYHANAAAAERLVSRIMPLVWRVHPHVPVVLAGKEPPAGIVALGRDPRVTVTGYVDDLRTVLARAVVAACPLVYGAGIQNKVLEALASGVPAVMSVAAATALRGEPGRDYIACDTDRAFADALVRLLEDPEERTRLAANGRAYVAARHRWLPLAERLVEVYREAGSGVATPTA